MAEKEYKTNSEICCECGLCCDGTIFSTVSLDKPAVFINLLKEKNEHEYLKKNDLKTQFPLPCPCFDGTCCIYNDRPEVCKTFLCTGIKNVNKGKQTASELIKTIKQTKSLKKEISDMVKSIPYYENFNIIELKSECQPVIKESIKPYSELILKIGMLAYSASKLHENNSIESGNIITKS